MSDINDLTLKYGELKYNKKVSPIQELNKITVYEGVQAFKKATEDVYEVMSKNPGIVRLSGLDRALYFMYFGEGYMLNFYRRLASLNNIMFKCINVTEGKYLTEEREGFTEDRFISNEYFNGISTYIYHDKIVHMMWQSLKVIFVEDSELAATHRNQFDLVWNKVAKQQTNLLQQKL